MATSDTSEVAHSPLDTPPSPDELPVTTMESVGWPNTGFLNTVRLRLPDRTGNLVWAQAALPLIEGEEPTELERFCTIIDIANGVGSRLDISEWMFMNTDSTVHLTRTPSSSWAGIAAAMHSGPTGFGYTASDLYDTDGPVGRSTQAILLQRH